MLADFAERMVAFCLKRADKARLKFNLWGDRAHWWRALSNKLRGKS